MQSVGSRVTMRFEILIRMMMSPAVAVMGGGGVINVGTWGVDCWTTLSWHLVLEMMACVLIYIRLRLLI